MKNTTIEILISFIILISCQVQNDKKKKVVSSNFNLKTDYVDFKHKMTELDTLMVFIEHSVCTYRGREKLMITKKGDSLKIRSTYFEATFNKHPKWELVYEKTISENDTIWDFEKFLIRNKNRMISKTKKWGRIQITHKNDTIQFFTKGLVDLNRLMADYSKTMIILYPENKNGMYSVEFVVEIDGEN